MTDSNPIPNPGPSNSITNPNPNLTLLSPKRQSPFRTPVTSY